MKKLIILLLGIVILSIGCTKPILFPKGQEVLSVAKASDPAILVNITYNPVTFELKAETIAKSSNIYYRSGQITLVQYTGSSFEFPYYSYASDTYAISLSLKGWQAGRYFFKAFYYLDGISYSSIQATVLIY